MTLTALEKIQAKYDDDDDFEVQGPSDERPRLASWKDSEAVVLLSAFIKEYRDYGFSIEQTRQGKVMVAFNPGLKLKEKDPKRFELAEHLLYLMDQAREDLEELIFNGELTFPESRYL